MANYNYAYLWIRNTGRLSIYGEVLYEIFKYDYYHQSNEVSKVIGSYDTIYLWIKSNYPTLNIVNFRCLDKGNSIQLASSKDGFDYWYERDKY